MRTVARLEEGTLTNPSSTIVGALRQRASSDDAVQLMHAALASLHTAAKGSAAKVAGAAFVRTESMALSIAANLPASAIVLNHGFVQPDACSVTQAADIYHRAGVERFFLSSLAEVSPAIRAAAGVTRARSWRLFRRDLCDPVPAAPTAIDVSRIGSEQAFTFAQIVADAFDLGEASCPMLSTLPRASGWIACIGSIEGQPAGTGALFVSNGLAWTDFGATSPVFRGRGVQKALLSHRVRLARSLGCHTILTCTGEEVAGEAQISYRNILNAGFCEAETMFNYAPR